MENEELSEGDSDDPCDDVTIGSREWTGWIKSRKVDDEDGT